MEEIVQKYISEVNVAESSKKAYEKHLRWFHRWLEDSGGDLVHLTLADTQMYITYLSRHKAPSTVTQASSAIRSFCAHTGQHRAIQGLRVPVQAPEPSAPKALTRQEELECFRKLQRHVHSRQPLYIAVFTFLLCSGVRAGELCGIDMDDIKITKVKNGYRGEVTVRGKGNKYRTIPVPHQACQAVMDWLAVRPEVSEQALFLSTQRNRLNVRGVERICEKAGTHPHALRHTYLTRLVRNKDIDIVIAAELAGHSSVKTTQRYTKPSKQELIDAIERAF